MFTTLLTTVPTVAVTATVPLVWLPATSVTRPAETVARLELLVAHVAVLVRSNGPLHVVAVANSGTLGLLAVNAWGFVGVT